MIYRHRPPLRLASANLLAALLFLFSYVTVTADCSCAPFGHERSGHANNSAWQAAVAASGNMIVPAELPDCLLPAGTKGHGAVDACCSAAFNDYALQQLEILGAGWGYNYADLLHDLDGWKNSPYATVDSIGRSVQNRAIWLLRLTSGRPGIEQRQTITIHARTHPGEFQAWRVTEQMIQILLEDSDLARMIRRSAVVHIVPMLNPDGVELDLPRHNANDIDLEREWDKNPMQPEAAALKQHFEELMASANPIRLALNMHSAFRCRRYFVFHDPSGTSAEFADRQQRFISGVRRNFPDGIEAWDFSVTWVNNTPTHFPESWFWFNFGSDVMALTYEDMNCDDAGEYRRTAEAILRGIADFLELPATTGLVSRNASADAAPPFYSLPNPARDKATLHYRLTRPANVRISLCTEAGLSIASFDQGRQFAGEYRQDLQTASLASGVYFWRIELDAEIYTASMLLLR